jgi:hypothetical protein
MHWVASQTLSSAKLPKRPDWRLAYRRLTLSQSPAGPNALPDTAAGVLHALLDSPFLPAGGDIAEVGIEEIVRGHGRKAGIDGAGFAATRHAIHRRFHIVVDATTRDATETGQTAGVGIEEHLVALAGGVWLTGD